MAQTFCSTLVTAVASTVFLIFAPAAHAAQASAAPVLSQAPAGDVVTGVVLEVKEVESYTYLRLKTEQGETWAAVAKTTVKTGDQVTIENALVMDNFESKGLQRTFETIVFGTRAISQGSTTEAEVAAVHAAVPKASDVGDIHVPKASGANAHTVADIMGKSADLKDQTVVIRGQIVKYSAQVMGKNWIHLRDGSGSAADQTNDVTVTTNHQAKVGDVVTVQGVVRTNKDFGAGYSYKVIVEEATLQK